PAPSLTSWLRCLLFPALTGPALNSHKLVRRIRGPIAPQTGAAIAAEPALPHAPELSSPRDLSAAEGNFPAPTLSAIAPRPTGSQSLAKALLPQTAHTANPLPCVR